MSDVKTTNVSFASPWRSSAARIAPTSASSWRTKAPYGVRVVSALSKVPAKLQPLAEWARKAVSPTVTSAVTAARQVVKARVIDGPAGPIKIDGWEKVQRSSAHSFDALAGVIVDCVQKALGTWGWSATGLEVSFHAKQHRALGLAYNPGSGIRRISLNVNLLSRYDLESIFRTTIHELCHHAREELHPRQR